MGTVLSSFQMISMVFSLKLNGKIKDFSIGHDSYRSKILQVLPGLTLETGLVCFFACLVMIDGAS